MKGSRGSVLYISQAAMIAAAYTALTIFAASIDLASGAVQVRFSEVLTILPAFTGAAVPGLFLGCLLSNFVTGCAPYDVIFGSIATLLGALGTRALKDRSRFLSSIPPILANTIIVPFILSYVYEIPGSIPFFMLTVGAGEVISCGILGQLLYSALLPHRKTIFEPQPDADRSLMNEDDSDDV